MNSSQIEACQQMTARCLFPDSQAKQRPAVSFSIGDIMKSVGLPAQESTSAAKSPSRAQPPLSIAAPMHLQNPRQSAPPASVSKLHLNHLIFQNTNPHLYQYGPSFHAQTNGRYPTSEVSTTPSSRSSTLLHVPAPTEQPSDSPHSNTSVDLVDVESTSPTGSTSSGFHSNPSPNSSSHISSSPETQSDRGRKDLLPPANSRTSYTDKQVRRLKQVLAETSYPDVELYEQLSEELNIPMTRLRVWFQNRRARNKRRLPNTTIAYPVPMQPMSPMLPSQGYGLLPQFPIMPYSFYPYPAPASPMMSSNIYYGQPYPLPPYPHN